MSVGFDVKGQRGMSFFFTGGSIIMEYGLTLKCLIDGFVSSIHIAFTSQLVHL